jgi:glycosyltransferase involved in cell wall biosynthesis
MTKSLRIAMLGVRGFATSPPPRFRRGDTLLVGGAELAAEGLSCALARRGHAVTLFTRGGDDEDVGGVRLHPSWYLPGRRSEALSHTLWGTIRAMRSGYDVIHYHAVGPGSCAALARLAGVPTVVTVQGLDWQREKWRGWERRTIQWLGRLGLRAADAAIAVAPSLVPFVQAEGARRVICIPNGYADPGDADLGALAALRLTPGRYFLMLTRLVPEKNVHRVIAAYGEARVDWPLVIAGGGSHSDDYVRALHDQARHVPGVCLVGVVRGTAKAALLTSCGAFINASDVEGLSLAVLEALGAGVPVGLSHIPANLDIFRMIDFDKDVGPVVFDPGNVDAIAEGLRTLWQLPETLRVARRRLGEHVRDRFAWDRIAAETEAVYSRVLASPNPASMQGEAA